RDSAVRLYDVKSGTQVWSRVVKLTNANEYYLSGVAFAPNGKTVATGASDNCIYLFDATTGEPAAKMPNSEWYSWTVAFTADSRTIYSSGWDGVVRRWDVASQKQLPP